MPDDALIVPYNVKSPTGIKDAEHLLVPYDRYVELWNLANPDKKIDAHPAPLPYALSGAAYSAVLEGEETLNVTGQMQVNVLAEGYVSIPLGLRGGVLARADLDGKPARLKVVSAAPEYAPQTKSGKVAAAMDATLLVLQVSDKGSHKLELEVRLKLARVGGWRGTTGSLPTAPAATVTFRVPQAQTEVRLGQAADRRIHETQRPDETLETALGPGGALQLQWRPKVAEAQVDRGLTVEIASLLDVQEDGLRMALHLNLQFRRGQRDDFTLSLPAEYLVEKVAGNNVRGWEVQRAADGADRRRQPAENGQGQRAVQSLPLPQRQSGAGPARRVRRAHGDGPRRGPLQRAIDHPPQLAPGRPHHGALWSHADRSWPAARPERRTGDRGERAGDPALRGLSLPHDALRAAIERRGHHGRGDRRGPDERQARSARSRAWRARSSSTSASGGSIASRSPCPTISVCRKSRCRRRGFGRSRRLESRPGTMYPWSAAFPARFRLKAAPQRARFRLKAGLQHETSSRSNCSKA